jgi:hypothetical protein
MQKISRRHALRIAAVGIMSSTAAAVVTQQLTTGSSQAAGDVERFDEIYQGRRITVAASGAANTKFAIASNAPQILIDGAALHVMTNADATYTSVVNHYQSFRSLRAVARAAVDDLGGATLVQAHHHG